MSEENKAVYRLWVDALNARSFDALGEFFTDPFTHNGAERPLAAYRTALDHGVTTSFPDLRMT